MDTSALLSDTTPIRVSAGTTTNTPLVTEPEKKYTQNNNTTTGKNDRFIVKYRKNYYDITEFLKKHPGGLNTLHGLQHGDIDMTSRFPMHSDAAMYLMHEYKIPAPKNLLNKTKHKINNNGVNKMLNDRGIELLDDKAHEEDGSLEHLVNWKKAMLPQIHKITAQYDEWVHKPVDRKLRLFDAWYLEILTETPWWLVPLFWLPVIAKCIKDETTTSWQQRDYKQLSYLTYIFMCGILLWTLLEYSLHRWVFHMRVNGNASGWLCTMHFLIHGLHHKVPFDPNRLVFPPLPGAIIATILYTPLSFLAPHPRMLLAGALFGYLIYDMMHYYLHYGSPTIKHFYYMKRYHYQHHFSHQQVGFGISSPLWDYIFNTKIHLRKLRYQLRW